MSVTVLLFGTRLCGVSYPIGEGAYNIIRLQNICPQGIAARVSLENQVTPRQAPEGADDQVN